MKKINNTYKSNKGITLIALIITIIILLILAGVSISAVVGKKGVIGESQSAATVTLHSEVYERVTLEADAYWALKESDDYNGDLLSYFNDKGYIEIPKREEDFAGEMVGTNNISEKSQINELIQSSSTEKYGTGLEEEPGFDINVEKLLERKIRLGIGSNKKNVYRLEKKLSSAESHIRDTDINSEIPEYSDSPEYFEEANEIEIIYEVCYYDFGGNREVLGEIEDTSQGVLSLLG